MLLHEMNGFKDFTREVVLNWLGKCCYSINYITISKEESTNEAWSFREVNCGVQASDPSLS